MAGVGLAMAAAACVNTSARLREALVGMPARELRTCLGSPLDIAEKDGTEIARYRWAQQIDTASVFGGNRADLPEVQQRVRDWPVDGSSEEDRKKASRRRRAGYCELRFALRDGKVQSVEAEGRSQQGINLDGECLLRARECVPRERLFGLRQRDGAAAPDVSG